MTPEEVPDDLAEKAARARRQYYRDALSFMESWEELPQVFRDACIDEQRVILAAVLPSYKQRVTAKYRRFVKAVRVITRNGESYQTPKSQGGGGDECTISPPELRQALTDLRHGRQ